MSSFMILIINPQYKKYPCLIATAVQVNPYEVQVHMEVENQGKQHAVPHPNKLQISSCVSTLYYRLARDWKGVCII